MVHVLGAASLKHIVALVFVCFAASLGLSACKTTAVQNFNDVPVVSVSRAAAGDNNAVRSAIFAAGEKLKWVMTEPESGEILATYTVRGHMVQVSIPYTAKQYSILYSNSERMNYKDGVVHPKYNVWVASLNREIQAQLNPESAAKQPATTSASPPNPVTMARPAPQPPQPENLSDADDASQLKNVSLGRYHALVIGIDTYDNLPDLKTAVADARAVAQVLTNDYGYNVRLLANTNRERLMDALDKYVETLTASDNLLIYYAGHGHRDEASNRGYWLPADATRDRRTYWISNADI